MQLNKKLLVSIWVLAALAAPLPALAYTGPGLGLGAIGVALGVIGSIFLGIFSLVWYPVKRMLRRRRGSSTANKGGQQQ